MAVIKDLGAVTAYASAVEGGYTGTKEEFETLMASYATVAEEAAESAESASQSAESASASAQTATTKASEASTSATQASASATSASQSAQTATAKASEASASASTASTKASEASASATTASSKASEASASATNAQTAQGLAESARDDAIDAKTDAESARDMAQQYAESIDPEKIYSAYPTDTASGDVASFADGADNIPLKSVKVAIEPVQSGSGDPSPDNVRPISGWTGAQVVRAGKNLLPPATIDTDTKNGVTWTKNSDGSISFSGTATAAVSLDFINFKLPAGSYLFSNAGSTASYSGGSNIPVIYVRDLDNSVTLALIKFGTVSDGVAFTLSAETNIRFYTVIQADYAVSGTLYPMVRLASVSDATYAPFTEYDTYSIIFPPEAGTVYGGTLDVTSGTLTVDRAMVDLGTLTWTKDYSDRFFYSVTPPLFGDGGTAKVDNPQSLFSICEMYKNGPVNTVGTINGNFMVANSQRLPILRVSDDRFSDAASFKTAVDGVKAVLFLREPIIYTLTPTEIESLLGENHVWADAGNTEVTYRADTAKYIDKKIAEVINALS